MADYVYWPIEGNEDYVCEKLSVVMGSSLDFSFSRKIRIFFWAVPTANADISFLNTTTEMQLFGFVGKFRS